MQSDRSMSPVAVQLSAALHQRIKTLAHVRNQSTQAVMLQAIKDYVEREENREALRQEVDNAHQQYRQTGLHLTNAEVLAWMDQMVQGEKAPMPKCHT